MKIHVHIVPWSKKSSIDYLWEDIFWNKSYKVKISAKPVDGEANKALIEFLAQHFDIPRRNVKIISGFTSREKLVEIEK